MSVEAGYLGQKQIEIIYKEIEININSKEGAKDCQKFIALAVIAG